MSWLGRQTLLLSFSSFLRLVPAAPEQSSGTRAKQWALPGISLSVSGCCMSSHCASWWRRPWDKALGTRVKCSLGPGHQPAMKGGNEKEGPGISPAEFLPKYGSTGQWVPLWFSPWTIQLLVGLFRLGWYFFSVHALRQFNEDKLVWPLSLRRRMFTYNSSSMTCFPCLGCLLPNFSLLCTCKEPFWASLVAQLVKNLPAMQETWVQSLGWEDPLEKQTATLSSILAWSIPWTIEPGRPQSIELQSWTWLSDFHFTELFYMGPARHWFWITFSNCDLLGTFWMS